MKKLTLIFAIFAIFAFMFCITLTACYEANVSPLENNDYGQEELTTVTEPHRFPIPTARSRAMRAYATAENLYHNNDPNFIGMGIDRGYLNILLNSHEPEVLERFRELWKDYLDVVVFIEPAVTGYTRRELTNICDIVFETMPRNTDYRFNGVSICRSTGKIKLSFSLENIDDELLQGIEVFLSELIAENAELSDKGVTLDLFVLTGGTEGLLIV
jgi:hypothetical protein